MIQLEKRTEVLEKHKDFFGRIKAHYSKLNPVEANLNFNYAYYRALVYVGDNQEVLINTKEAIIGFVAKETSNNYVAAVTTSYEMAMMISLNELILICSGKFSNLIDIRYDSVKLGCLAAINYKINSIGFFDLLNDLLLTKNVI